MLRLLRSVLTICEPVHSGIDVAIVLLEHLPQDEARSFLEKRLNEVTLRRHRLAQELEASGKDAGSAGEHILILVDAEIRWLKRAIHRRTPDAVSRAKHARPAGGS
jgi:hypothetical protein